MGAVFVWGSMMFWGGDLFTIHPNLFFASPTNWITRVLIFLTEIGHTTPFWFACAFEDIVLYRYDVWYCAFALIVHNLLVAARAGASMADAPVDLVWHHVIVSCALCGHLVMALYRPGSLFPPFLFVREIRAGRAGSWCCFRPCVCASSCLLHPCVCSTPDDTRPRWDNDVETRYPVWDDYRSVLRAFAWPLMFLSCIGNVSQHLLDFTTVSLGFSFFLDLFFALPRLGQKKLTFAWLGWSSVLLCGTLGAWESPVFFMPLLQCATLVCLFSSVFTALRKVQDIAPRDPVVFELLPS
jgi:hypothetical protein